MKKPFQDGVTAIKYRGYLYERTKKKKAIFLLNLIAHILDEM